jgi:hypothetical protein
MMWDERDAWMGDCDERDLPGYENESIARGEWSPLETLRCPVCGTTITRREHPGALHCGPHGDRPAVRMRALDGDSEFGRLVKRGK